MLHALALALGLLAAEDRLTFNLGAGAGARLDATRYGQGHGRVRERTGFASLYLRVAGYLEKARPGLRPRVFLVPDLHVLFAFGGTTSDRDPAALAAGHAPARRGGYLGLHAVAGVAAGVVSPRPNGPYLKLGASLRALAGGATEQALLQLPLGLGAGLRVAFTDDVALLFGGKLEASLGVQALGRTRLVAQLAPGCDLLLQARVGHRGYLGLSATFDRSALAHPAGGRRTHGRATLDLAIPLKNLRLSLFGLYAATAAATPAGPAERPPEGLLWVDHTLGLGLGLGA